MITVSKETEEWMILELKKNIEYFSHHWNKSTSMKDREYFYDRKCANERMLNLFISKQNKTLYPDETSKTKS